MALIAMLSLLSILAIIVTTVNIINFANVRGEADDILEVLIENEGQFGDISATPPTDGEDEEEDKDKEALYPEVPYETRYFTALIDDESLRVVELNTKHIVALREGEVLAYLNKIYFGKSEKGFLGNYRYAKEQTAKGTLIVVVDWNRQLTAANTFLVWSVLVSLMGSAAAFFLVMYLSKQAVKPIEENNARQKRFITDSSHELKTPLAIISANAEVLEMEYGENEWTESIRHQVQRLTTLTSRLTQLARLDENDQVMTSEVFDFSDLVQEAVFGFSTLAERGEKQFTETIEQGICFKGNREAMAQLVSILLDNAVKYAHTKIEVSLEKRGNRFDFVVRNDVSTPCGTGSLERFFDRFWRGDQSRSSETPGFGIGLSLARTIVDKQGGSLTAESPDGHTVVMTLHLRSAE